MGDKTTKTKCIDLSKIPFQREGFYATNNQFQKAGSKGFIQVKVLENDNLYIRVDLPGVPDDAIHHRVDAVRQKIVFFSGETLGTDYEKDGGVREYSGTAGLGCDCCEITGVEAKMKDGVLRMIVSRVKAGKSGRYVEDHQFVVKGRKGAYVGEPTEEGGFYFAVDMPGVSGNDIKVYVVENEIRFYAETKKVSEHDDDDKSPRVYLGSFESSSTPWFSAPNNIICNASFGVLRLLIAPPLY